MNFYQGYLIKIVELMLYGRWFDKYYSQAVRGEERGLWPSVSNHEAYLIAFLLVCRPISIIKANLEQSKLPFCCDIFLILCSASSIS